MNILAALILIPTLYNGPGALGSRWSTLVVLNTLLPARGEKVPRSGG